MAKPTLKAKSYMDNMYTYHLDAHVSYMDTCITIYMGQCICTMQHIPYG
jgi:hypothetical protein